MSVELGKRYRDSFTGFEGVATAITDYLYGCKRVALEGPMQDGKLADPQWFDEQRLDATSTAKTGGPGLVAPGRDAPLGR